MLSISVEGKTVALRPDGRLANLEDWSESVAKALAEKEGVHLTSRHWEIIHAMRGYYNEYNISPVMKLLKKAIKDQLGDEKSMHEYLNDLFPRHVLIQGTLIAGIPMPLLDAELEYHAQAKPDSSEAIKTFEFEGKSYEMYRSGNLVHMGDWNERLAEFLAEMQGIRLTPEHWEVLRFLRNFYFQYGIAPMVRLLKNHITETLGKEKAGDKYLYGLFPGGPSRQGSRIAGLPEPQGCIDPS